MSTPAQAAPREMKDSGVEWIGEIPVGWEVTKIGSLYDERSVKVSDREYSPLSVSKMGIVPQLKSAAKTDNGDQRKLIRKGDFVINSRSDRRGACGISDYDGSCSLINIVLSPRKEVNNAYFSYVFRSELFADEFYRWGNGIVDDLWSTKWSSMKRIYIPMPPHPIQQRIAAYLDRKCGQIDAIIEKQKQVIEKLKAYKLSVITEAVTKGLDPNVAMKDSGVEWMGMVPKGWEVKKAKYEIIISHGSDPTTEGCIPVYGSGAESFKTCGEFKEGPCVLVGRKGATLHIPHYIDGPYWNVDTAFDCKSRGRYNLRFYYYAAMCFDYKKESSQTTLPGMTQTTYHNMLLPCPNSATQAIIANYLDKKCAAIDSAIASKETLIAKLISYKKSLIYELVTGKRAV